MKHKVLCADPAWPFDDKLPGETRGAASNYHTMTIPDIMRMPLPPLDDDCVLFLWRVAAMQQEALDVIYAWGFNAPQRELVWLKKTVTGRRWFGMGRVVRAEHEVCLIATRGKPRVHNHSVRSTFVTEEPLVELAPDFSGLSAQVPQYVNRRGKVRYRHSAKPETFYDIVEQLVPGPYAEIFARRRRPGWTCHGDELVPEFLAGSNVVPRLTDQAAPLLEGSGGPGICRCNEYETCAVCVNQK